MADAVWSGYLRLSSAISCPVHLSPAAREAETITLTEINARTGNPVVQQFVDSRTGDVVGADDIVKGYQGGRPGYVAVTDSQIEALGGAAPSIIDVAHFCWRDQIDRARVETSLYVYPESGFAADTLDALRLAMRRSGRDAIAYIHLGGRERIALIQVQGGGLVLSTLRPPRLPEPAEFPERADGEVPAELVENIEGIIQSGILVGDANTLPDRYELRLRTLIEGGAAMPPPAQPEAADGPPPLPPASPSSAAVIADAPPAPSAPTAPRQPPVWAEEARLAAERGLTGAAQMDADRWLSGPPRPQQERSAGREIGTEILLLILGLGDQRFVEAGWAGRPGSRRQIEAISIRPGEELPASAIEFRVFAREGRATSWVSNGNYAGTRGRQEPLTGFAVRPSHDMRERLDIVYEGCFFDGGVVGPRRNGDICTSPIGNDPLEAVRITIYLRS